MDYKEFALTLDSLWKAEIGKDRLDYVIEALLDMVEFPELKENET